jgi:dolichol-phosphate mannosyltransferase
MNEEETLGEFCRRACAALGDLPYEIVLVDDGSTDSTPRLLERIAARDDRIRPIYLSRNFGHQAALRAGLDHAYGDVVISIDADLQDPPELIPTLIDHWSAGSDVVHAVRRLRPGEPRWKLAAKRSYYRIFSALSSIDYLSDAGDFRLFDREALQAVLRLGERRPFVRGMAVWIGYTQTEVPYDRDRRYAGESKWSLPKTFAFAADGIVSFSNVPLQFATAVGALVSAVAVLLALTLLIARIAGHPVPGVSGSAILISALGGVQLISLGILGLYLARVLAEVRARPIYIVRQEPLDPVSTDEFLARLSPSEAALSQPGLGQARIQRLE